MNWFDYSSLKSLLVCILFLLVDCFFTLRIIILLSYRVFLQPKAKRYFAPSNYHSFFPSFYSIPSLCRKWHRVILFVLHKFHSCACVVLWSLIPTCPSIRPNRYFEVRLFYLFYLLSSVFISIINTVIFSTDINFSQN